MRRVLLLAGLCATLGFASAATPAAADHSAVAQRSATLLDKWFELQASGSIYAPYAFIEKTAVQDEQDTRKQSLLARTDNLIWRLQAAGQGTLAHGLSQWRWHIAEATHYRTPGRWGPTALLSGAAKVDIDSVAAIGACSIPNWVEIWSVQGVRRLPWQPQMQLAMVLAGDTERADGATLITPYGHVVQAGTGPTGRHIRHNMQLLPGMRVILPPPLGAQAARWLGQSLAAFLAHIRPGDDCRSLNVRAGASSRGG